MGHPNLVLNPKGGEDIEVGGRDPAIDLRPWIAKFWTTRWDFRGRPPRVSELLTDTAVHLAIERGASRIVGPTTRKFTRRLDGRGRIVALRFATGAVRAFTDVPVVDLVDRIVALGPTLRVDDVAAVEEDVLGEADDEGSLAALERFVRARLPAQIEPALVLVQRLVALAEEAPDLTTVTELCARGGIDRRALQRLFRGWLGLGPKHVIRRARLREAAERIRVGASENFAALAAALGYFDQAHFARDFKAATGRSPSQWARELAPR